MDNSLRESILRRDKYSCKSCGKRTMDHVHYVLPPHAGGPDSPMNLVTLCNRCQMLVNPTSVDHLLESLDISMREFFTQKARAEIAIQTWVLETLDRPVPVRRRRKRLRGRSRPEIGRRHRDRILERKRSYPRAGKKWSSKEDEMLLQNFDAGLSVPEIAATLGRGEFSIEVRLWKLGRADLLPGKNSQE